MDKSTEPPTMSGETPKPTRPVRVSFIADYTVETAETEDAVIIKTALARLDRDLAEQGTRRLFTFKAKVIELRARPTMFDQTEKPQKQRDSGPGVDYPAGPDGQPCGYPY